MGKKTIENTPSQREQSSDCDVYAKENEQGKVPKSP